MSPSDRLLGNLAHPWWHEILIRATKDINFILSSVKYYLTIIWGHGTGLTNSWMGYSIE